MPRCANEIDLGSTLARRREDGILTLIDQLLREQLLLMTSIGIVE